MVERERRAAPRIRAYRPVKLRRHAAQQPIETLTKDVSAGGLRCLSPIPVPVTTPLKVELVFSDGQESFGVTGRAVWFRVIPQSDQFDLGIAFDGLSDENKRRLSVYLSNLSTKSFQL